MTGADVQLDIDFARSHFSALNGEWALFENAGGTLAANSVRERMGSYMAENFVQPGAAYDASAEGARRIAESQRLMAQMIGAEPDEVMVGVSTSMNVFLLSEAIRRWFEPGDEIICTNLDHEANNGAWRRLEEFGLIIREWRFNAQTAELELAELEKLLGARTRLVCFSHLSNIAGGINDVAEITRRVHEAGALVCVDGVAYAPHRALDVKAWDVDFYLCSLYKLYGPHLSLLYGKREHLARAANNNHFFLSQEVPLKLNPGGPNHELTAALSGITDYFDRLHRHHFPESNLAAHDRIKQVFALMADHEERIAAPFVEFLRARPGVRLIGRRTAAQARRAPTFSFTVAGRRAEEIPAALLPFKVAIGSGDFYAARCIRDLGLEAQGGVIRASMVHYNSAADVARLIEALDRVI
jgi:cysteine desulfurase family protein (TIGR01976 family)